MKLERRPYDPVLERKLEQLPGVDADHLWDGMHAILDKKMPQKRERRRFIVWFLNDSGLFLVGIAALITAAGFCLFFLSPNKTSSIANSTNKISHLPQQNKSNDNNTVDENSAAVTSDNKKEIAGANSNMVSDDQISEQLSNVPGASGEVYISQGTRRPINSTSKSDNTRPKQAASMVDANQETQNTNFETGGVINEPTEQNSSYITSEDFNSESQNPTNNEQEKNSSVQDQATPQSKPAGQNIRVHNEKGLYAGIVSGMDLSSIHFQSVRTGATQGLILGYAFNNRLSLESGVLWDKKRFYDDGTYFDPPGYTPSSSVQIVAVNGTNRIYEWPLNVKYTIIPAKHSLFATAGLSSYFMKSEHYDYEYVQNNQPGGHNYMTYNNASKNWFSVVNLSLGYAHKLGSIGSLRIEPYFKIPIKNLGIANMPIMSTGLNIGFTRSLTR